MIELTIASIFWGFGFTATVWSLETLSFPALTFYRFFGAFIFGSAIWFYSKPDKSDLWQDFKNAKEAGFWLGLTLILQTWGLLTTSPTKSAFITVLYVIFVPLLAAIIDKHRLSTKHLFALGIALVGTSMIIQIDFANLNFGDLITLANAVTAAFQIRVLGKLAPKAKSHYNFNLFQCLWTSSLCLPLLIAEVISPNLFKGSWNLFSLNHLGLLGLLSLTFGSSLLAFFLQVRAQDKVNPSVAAILFLMESPFSAFFAAWLLGERLSMTQLVGAGLIFVACFVVSVLPSSSAKAA